jgi:hypothetical protein
MAATKRIEESQSHWMSAPFPKFVRYCGASDTNFGNKGALAALRLEAPDPNLRHPVQELQIGGALASLAPGLMISSILKYRQPSVTVLTFGVAPD